MRGYQGLRLAVLLSLAASNGTSARDFEEDMKICAQQPTEERRTRCETLIRKVDGKQDCAEVKWLKADRSDPMTDKKSCTVSIVTSGKYDKDGSPFAYVSSAGVQFVVQGETYPGTDSMIRIDDLKAHTFREESTSAQGRAILKEIRAGTTIKTQYTQWPSNAPADHAIAICDLASLIDECAASVAGTRKH